MSTASEPAVQSRRVKRLDNPAGRRLIERIIRSVRRHLTDELENPNQAGWIETLVVSLLAISIAWLVRPDDPFLLQEAFPWLLVVPLFLSLRHGFAFGFTSALFLTGLMIAAWRFDWVSIEAFPASQVLGMLIVTMLAGEFSDLWRRRLGRIEIESTQRDRRMDEFTRSYHLLKVSHDQLVEHLAGSSVSLRQAIAGVRMEMLNGDLGSDPLEAEAETILALFRRYGAVQSASLHRVTVENRIDVRPLGRLGAVPEDMQALNKSSIVNESLDSGSMVSVLATANGAPRYVDGNILAVAPIRDLDGITRALLVIYRIPFLKFTDENLSLIAVMGSYLGDLLHDLEQDMEDKEEARGHFYAELKRSIFYVHHFDMHARLLAVEIQEEEALEDLVAQRRSLDRIWLRTNSAGHPVVLWLMPFTDDYGIAGFEARIHLWAQQRFDSESGESFVKIRNFSLSGDDSVAAVMDKVNHACKLVDA